MKSQRLLLLISISAFILFATFGRFSKADDATSTTDATPVVLEATSTNSTSTIADATSTTLSSTPPPPPVNINFDIEGTSSTLFSESSLSVAPCATPNNTTLSENGFCAFAAAGAVPQVSWSAYGAFVTSINGVAGDANNFWLWFLNGDPAQVGIDGYILKPGDSVLWTLKREPLKVSLSTTTPSVNAAITVTVLGFNPVKFDFEPVAGALIVGTEAITDTNGIANIIATSTNPFVISVTANGFVSSKQFTITPKPERIMLTIRDKNTTAFSGSLLLPDKSTADILVTPTNSTTSIAVSPRSVLGILKSLEASSTNFDITNLSYFKAYNSFLINCIAVPADASAPDCYNWTDAVDGIYPQVGINQQMLNNGDTVYLFFGSPHQVVLSAGSAASGQSFTATAQQYDLSSGIYKPLPGVALGVGTSNSDFTFTELATSTTDASGQAVFTLNTAGTFSVGIKEDSYFPSVPITITNTSSTPQSGGSSESGSEAVHSTFNITNALTFISNNQNADGSFDSPYSTDWTAIALSAAGTPGNTETKLRNYLLNSAPTLSTVTDYERHAMALEALGINPYSDTSINYISAITNAFSNVQTDTSADNDNIFALPPLLHAGFTSNDPLIQKIAASILSVQSPDGSWDGTPDMTAAALQALSPLSGISGVSNALSKAAGYLASTQDSAGGWGNMDSTSWVQTAINGLIETRVPGFQTESVWSSLSGLLPTDTLAAAQKPDGGADVPANRVWSTSYAIVAASGKSWMTILNSFSRPKAPNSNENGTAGQVLGAATSTDNTLADPNATTTPKITSTSSPVAAIPAIIEIPTTTAKVLLMPKLKPDKLYVKTAKKIQAAQTPKPTQMTSQIQAVVSKKPGFFERVWQTIISFFSHLF